MKRLGLPKDYRLLKRADFISQRGKAQKIYTKNFTIICHENRENGSRIGIVASKKVGNAVTRNRVKRLIREFFRLNRGRMSRSEDVIVIVKPKTRINRYTDIEGELRGLL